MLPSRQMAAAGLVIVLSACGHPSTDFEESPLFDRDYAPRVLSEARTLAPPPDVGPNRFIRGWRPWQREDRSVWLVPRVDARLELVDLGARPRRLVFDGEKLTPEPAWVEISMGGETRRVELADRFEVDLPPAEEPGRRVVDFHLEEGGAWAARAVGVEPASSGGGAACSAGSCSQSGPSAIEVVRRVKSGTRLAGVFAPPARPLPAQSFGLSAREEGGDERSLVSWEPSWRSRFGGQRAFEIEIATDPGPARWVRLRFTATGEGPAGEWKELRLLEPGQKKAPIAPPIPPAPRLVILYVMDAMRADHVTHLGGEPGLTPVIDRLASEGATFRRHRSAAPNTLPSTKTLFTGQTFLLRGGWKLAADHPPTLAEAFTRGGYRSAIFSGNGNASADFGTDRGFEHADSSVLMGTPGYRAVGPDYNDNAARIHRAALEWLDGLGEDESAFVYLHTIHPHAPYDPPPELEERFTRGIDAGLKTSASMLRSIGLGRYVPSDAERRRLARLYAASVAYNDREIGSLMAELRRRFTPQEVLFVLTSDHGEELFDHGGVLHGYTLYNELVDVPLVMTWPGTISASSVEAPTGTADVHDALRSLVDTEYAATRPGLWRRLLGEERVGPEPWVQFAAASAVPGGIFSARTERWKLVWAPRKGISWGMGGGGGRTRDAEYLFDLAADRETVNLAGDQHLEVDWLRAQLRAWVENGFESEVGGEEAVLDESARARLRALGYLD